MNQKTEYKESVLLMAIGDSIENQDLCLQFIIQRNLLVSDLVHWLIEFHTRNFFSQKEDPKTKKLYSFSTSQKYSFLGIDGLDIEILNNHKLSNQRCFKLVILEDSEKPILLVQNIPISLKGLYLSKQIIDYLNFKINEKHNS